MLRLGLLLALLWCAIPAEAGELRGFLQSPGSRAWGDLRRTTDVQAQPCDCRCALFKFGPAWTVYRRPKLDDLRPEVDADTYLRNLARNLELRQAELSSCDLAELRAVHDVLEANAIDPEMTEAIGAYLDGRTPTDLATADGVVRGFYAFVLTQKPSGLLNPAEQEIVKKYLSPTLADLLARAWTIETGCAAKTPRDLKPPLFEGSQLVGSYEGATEVVVGPIKTRSGRATVESRLFDINPDYPKGHEYRAYTWTDELKLSMESGRWAIDDVLRGSVHDDGSTSLARSLRKFIRETTACAEGR
jgi:hypothetical protein